MAVAATDEPNDVELTLVELIRRDQGVTVKTSIDRFRSAGWSFQGVAPIGCNACPTRGRPVYRKPYTTSKGSCRYWAIVCLHCQTVDERSGVATTDQKALKAWDEGRPTPAALPNGKVEAKRAPSTPTASARWVSTFGGGSLAEEIIELANAAKQRLWLAVPWWRHRESDPTGAIFQATLDATARGVDVRVLMRNDASNAPTLAALAAAGVEVRCVRYLHFKALFVDDRALSFSANFTAAELDRNQNTGHYLDDGHVAGAEEAAWLALWNANAADVASGDERRTRADEVLPAELRRFLSREELNPLQAKAIPVVLASRRHVLVVAPTGAGKTDVGAAAVLRSIVLEGKKAVYLSPARALTRELSNNFDAWAKNGLRVLQVTGEDDVDAAALRRADLWVATIEKFESLYRRATLANAIADVGCIVVDEIHLVGDPQRGATLEALLARLRHLSSQTRLVGLSATVANADDIAKWLDADLVRSEWRPVQLSVQVLEYESGDSRRATEAAKDRLVRSLLDDVLSGDDSGQAIVFCGSKWAVEHTAAMVSGATGEGDALASAARAAGVGMHYRGLSGLRATEAAFRSRELRVLAATSGLATGVNLPARVVVIRDDTLGQSPLATGDALQMLGRAGRVGLETEGHGFLLVPADAATAWRRELAGGYSVTSHIIESLPDHVLADVLLGRLDSRTDLDEWFASTLAAYEGAAAEEALEEAIELLLTDGFVVDSDGRLRCTPKGEVTARFLVPVRAAAAALSDLATSDPPADAEIAEQVVLTALAVHVPDFRDAHVPPRALGILKKQLGAVDIAPGAQKTLYAASLALEHPRDLEARGTRAGFAVTDLRDLADALPRYLGWLAALGATAGWPAAVARDLAMRIEWRSARPGRAQGRLLGFLASVIPAEERRSRVPVAFARAVGRGYASPWDVEARPTSFPVDSGAWERMAAARASVQVGGVRIEDGELVVDVETRTDAQLSLSLRVAAGRSPVVVHCVLDGGEIRLPLPSGIWDGKVIVEIVAFSRSDWTYELAEVELHDAPTQFAVASRQIDDLVSRVPAVRWKGRLADRLSRKDTRRRARAWTLVESASPMLGDLARTLGGSGSALVDGRRFLRAVDDLLESSDDPAVRHPIAVVRSRRANTSERALIVAALLIASGWRSGLAEHCGDFVATFFDGQQWFALNDGLALTDEVIAIHPATMGTLTELRAASDDCLAPEPAMRFLSSFVQPKRSTHPAARR